MDTSQHKRNIKKALGADDLRRRRGETAVSIRRAKREEGLAKRRIVDPEPPALEDGQPQSASANSATHTYTAKDIPALAAGLNSNDLNIQLQNCVGLRKLLSVAKNPPALEVVAAGVVPIMVAFLGHDHNTSLQFEAAWVLTNITSTTTELTQVVVDAGVIAPLVRLLTHNSPHLREQCIWCLANIAGENPQLRDQVLAQPEALEGLLCNLRTPDNIGLLKNAVWALSNLCRGKKPSPSMRLLAPALPVLSQVLNTADDPEVLADAAWALSYLTDGTNERINMVVEAGVTGRLVQLLGVDDPVVITPTLRAVGNIVTGEDSATQEVLNHGVLPHLIRLMDNPKKSVRKEALWTVSNIAAGTRTQTAAVHNYPGMVAAVLSQLSSGSWEIQKEAGFVITNIITACSNSYLSHLVLQEKALEPLCDLLTKDDAKVALSTLDAIEHVLGRDDEQESFKIALDEAGGIEIIEELQNHENAEVYRKVVHIIDTYLGQEEQQQSLAPAHIPDDSTFSFGVAQHQLTAGGFNFTGGIVSA